MLTTLCDPLTDNLYTQGYHIIDNFLPEDYFQQLQSLAKQLHKDGSFQNAKIGRANETQQNNQIRTDQIYWIDPLKEEQSIQVYLQKINELIQILNQEFFLSICEFETHFAIYQPDSFYKKHIDQFKTTKNRKISCVYYLNEYWEPSYGGILKLYSAHNEPLHEVVPSSNRFLCFNSELPHEVTLTNQLRYSLTGWMKTRS